MNYLQRCAHPTTKGNRFFVKCIILAHMMSASIGTSVSSNVAPAVVRAVNVNNRGQVLGLWWTDKKILNEAAPGLATLTQKEVETAKEEVNKINLVSKIRYSMLALKGDFMDVSGSTVRYDLIKGSPKFQEYLTLVRQLEYVNLKELNVFERRAFLINIYNSLVIHALVEGLLKASPGGSLSRLQVRHIESFNIDVSNMKKRFIYPNDAISHVKLCHFFYHYTNSFKAILKPLHILFLFAVVCVCQL